MLGRFKKLDLSRSILPSEPKNAGTTARATTGDIIMQPHDYFFHYLQAISQKHHQSIEIIMFIYYSSLIYYILILLPHMNS